MAILHRARVVALGDQDDMRRLCQVLLQNSTWHEDQEDEALRARMPLTELIRQIRLYAQQEGGAPCEFCYDMLGSRLYGQAEPQSCRLSIRQEDCGLWTATFAYDSMEAFQQEDWLALHQQCGRLLMLALRASEDYGRARGMLIFSGGHILENWEAMDECWMYLMRRYECGSPPEEAVDDLRHIEEMLHREETELSVTELLQGCITHLKDVADHVSDPDMLRDMLEHCRAQRDYEGLFVLQCRIAEGALWEADRISLWLANLSAVLDAWQRQA